MQNRDPVNADSIVSAAGETSGGEAESRQGDARLAECLRRFGELENRYHPLGVIGEGGMGVVLKVKDAFLEHELAIKLVSLGDENVEERKERFAREMRVLAALDHPNIVKIRASGVTTKGNPYYVMDFLEGRSLADLLKDQRTLSASTLKQIIPQVLDGIIYLHQSKVVHRDLKPSNVVCIKNSDSNLQPKLIDFGVAMAQQSDGLRLTRTNVSVGTPEYMSPEQCRCEPVDERSDIYSFGCILFECITGRTPFSSESGLEVMYKHMHEEPPTIADSAKELTALSDLVQRCLAKDPAKRPASALELKQQFDSILESIDTIKMPRQFARKEKPARNLFILGTCVAVTVAVLVALPLLLGALQSDQRSEVVSLKHSDYNAQRAKKLEQSLHMANYFLDQMIDKKLELSSRIELVEKVVDNLLLVQREDADRKDLEILFEKVNKRLIALSAEVAKSKLEPSEKLSSQQAIVAGRIPVLFFFGRFVPDRVELSKKGLLELKEYSIRHFGDTMKQPVDAGHALARLAFCRGEFDEGMKLMDEGFALPLSYDATTIFVAAGHALHDESLEYNNSRGRAGRLILELEAEILFALRERKDIKGVVALLKCIEGLQRFNHYDAAEIVIKDTRKVASTLPQSTELDVLMKKLNSYEEINEKRLEQYAGKP